MKLSDYDYHLPPERIAQKPVKPRDSSRLFVLGKKLEHKIFSDICQYLEEGDVLAINVSKVIPAKVEGIKTTGGKATAVLTKRTGELTFEATLHTKRPKIGTRVKVQGNSYTVKDISDGVFSIEFSKPPMLEEIGKAPLPPYIKEDSPLENYQTVYAASDGSVAAPTAGLHFTEELLERIRAKGVKIACVSLHIGPGTFLPVKTDDIREHRMHSEAYSIPKEDADIINNRKGRLFIVGTTTLRCLESACEKGLVIPKSGTTDIFIYPGYRFKTDPAGLITNFHLPKSTLLMLVSAYAGRERILNAYQEAIKEGYRFYSFGDAMLIFPMG